MDYRMLRRGAIVPIALFALLMGCESGLPRDVAIGGSSTCIYDEGGSDTLIVGSTLLRPNSAMQNGGLVVLPSGKIGDIAAFTELVVAYPEASRLDCRGTTVLSPGWINVHEHEAFSYVFPDPSLSPIYRHREEWIFGRNDMPALPIPADQSYDSEDATSLAVLTWVELRHLVAGTTTLGGPGAMPGLAKNVGHHTNSYDAAAYTFEADLEIFPFSLEAITRFADVCEDHAGTEATLAKRPLRNLAYAPHVGEGRKTDCTAVSEMDAFVAHVEQNQGSGRRYSAVHAVAAQPRHLIKFGKLDVTLVWSPRSNVNLYGETIDLQESKRHGVRLALATDWSPSGSFNMLEEFDCARAVAEQQNSEFDARQLWSMATINAAYAVGIENAVGQLRPGLQADLILVRKHDSQQPYAAAVNASVDDILSIWVDGVPIVANAQIAERLKPGSECVALGARDKVICADFTALQNSWDDIVVVTREMVPMNGDTSGQSPCPISGTTE